MFFKKKPETKKNVNEKFNENIFYKFHYPVQNKWDKPTIAKQVFGKTPQMKVGL